MIPETLRNLIRFEHKGVLEGFQFSLSLYSLHPEKIITLVKKKIEDLLVTGNQRLNKDCFILTLRSGDPLPAIFPGQFAELRLDHSGDTFLRRPISFYDVDREHQEMRLLIREVGAGTRQLGMLGPGDTLNIIYPLGHPFTLIDGKEFLLAAGGVGIAPMLLLGKTLKQAGKRPVFLFGARSKEQMFDLAEFEDLGEVYITTEDGSMGKKGMITDHPILEAGTFDGCYSCGPEPMMKAIAKIAARKEIFCEVSLENIMACGIGACLCCAQPTVHGMKMACVDGPVFNTKELLW